MNAKNTQLIMISDIKPLLSRNKTLEENMTVAMKAAKNHWCKTDEKSNFNAAVWAVGEFYGIDSIEVERLKKSSEQLKIIQGLQMGLPIDLSVAMAQLPDDDEIKSVPLMKLWQDCEKTPEPKGGFINE